MAGSRNLTEGIAWRMLARDGIAAIWQLQVAAAVAYQTGNLSAAASIMEIADAAEEAWLRADRVRVKPSTRGH